MFDDQSFLRKTRYQRRQEQSRADRLTRAIRLLELQSDFATAQVWMRDRLDEFEQGRAAETSYYWTKARTEFVFRRFDIRAEAFVRLVSSIETQNAFMVVLEQFAREAWREYSGEYIEFLQPTHEEHTSVFYAIHKRTQEWTKKGYQRLAVGSKLDADVKTEVSTSKDAGSITSPVSASASETPERLDCAAYRRTAVDAFITRFKQQMGWEITKTHIWRSVGHTTARQFQYWQACDKVATRQDHVNFQRILAMSPPDFVQILQNKGVV